MADLESAESGRESAILGTTRRVMLRGTAGIGVAGLTAGVLAGAAASPAAAATNAPGTSGARAAATEEPLVMYLRDASTGDFELFAGEQRVLFTDRHLAARLVRAAH